MTIDFASVKSWTIPEGSVTKVTDSAGTVIWQKATADKYTWDAVFASIAAGTYATDYAIGDCVPLDLGSEGLVNMQIAGFDVDDLADGSGKAHISWISKELLATSYRMNPAIVSTDDGGYEAGTGAIGGWEQSEMRSYLTSTVGPKIPEPVASAIVAVKKTQPAHSTAGSWFTQTTEDWVWIPSYSEMFNGTYKSLFPDNASRVKYKVGSTSVSDWWLRSAYSTHLFHYVDTSGDWLSSGVGYSYGVALGFCT